MLVELEKVHKRFRSGEVTVHALRGVDLAIEEGAFVLILGASGSGKTTLLNLIGALDTPTSGRVRFGGRDLSELSARNRAALRAEKMGFVFQFFNLFPALNAVENVEIGLALTMTGRDTIHTRATKYLELVGLKDLIENYPAQISGGEQQRVAVARALAKEPRLLLADEPTGNLDYETGTKIWKLLAKLNRTTGTTVLAVTHQEEAATLADVVIRMRSGKVQCDGED